MTQVFLGQIVHAKSLNEFEIFVDGFVAIDEGKIIGVGEHYDDWKTSYSGSIVENQLTSTQFLMPGFVDCHIHAPQMPNIGLGLDKPLLEWLNTYTFPLESNYQNKKFALKVYEKVVRTTLNHGTTLAAYFATIHKNSCLILAKEARKQGQRAFIGKVSSDCNCPDYYMENYEDSIQDNEDFIEQVQLLSSDIVKPIITPRFAITCTEKMMKSLAALASRYNLNIQSHISENCNEINFVQELFNKSYAKVYFDAGLLTNKCVMAHGVHLEDEELQLFKTTGASIAHCPSSNISLSSGLCDVKRILKAGVKLGLGTDVSGGFNASVLDAIRRTLDTSKAIATVKAVGIKGSIPPHPDESYTPLDYKQALYLATLGGAEALSVSHKIGNFEVGKEFDALLIETNAFPIDQYELPETLSAGRTGKDRLMELVQKFIYVGDDRNIKNVFVQGRLVKQ